MNALSYLEASTHHHQKWKDPAGRRAVRSWTQQLDITDIYRLLHPAAECTFFSSSHGICTMIDQIVGHKTHLNKFKRIEIIQCLLPGQKGPKIETDNRKILKIILKFLFWFMCYLEIRYKISMYFKYFELNENKNTTSQNLWNVGKSVHIFKKEERSPWPVWLSWLGTVRQTQRLPFWFLLRVLAWVVALVSGWGMYERQQIDVSHIDVSLPLFLLSFLFLKINK